MSETLAELAETDALLDGCAGVATQAAPATRSSMR